MADPDDSPPASTSPRPPAGPSPRFGGDALLAVALSVLFLWLGSPFLAWTAHGFVGNPYGYVWPDTDPRAGQAVPMFEVEYGTAWRDVGLVATGVALLAEGVLLAVARSAVARTALRLTLAVGVAGLTANVLAAAMQVRAGFTQPLYAVIGAIICLISCVAAAQRRRDLGA